MLKNCLTNKIAGRAILFVKYYATFFVINQQIGLLAKVELYKQVKQLAKVELLIKIL